MVIQLGLPQTFQPDIILPVQEPDLRVAQPQEPGHLTVDGGIGSLHGFKGLFEVDIEGVLRQPGGDGHCQHLSPLLQQDTLHAQPLIVAEHLLHGCLFQQIILVGICRDAKGVPAFHHFHGSVQIVRGQRLHGAAGVLCVESVDMVSLFLEFPPPQICQIVDVIDIIKAVPAGHNMKIAGEPLLQILNIGFQQRGEPAGDAPVSGILYDGLHKGAAVAAADGVGVDALPMKMGEKGCAVSGEENVLLSPQVEVGKGVFAAPVGAVSENGLIGFLIRQADAVKIQHEKGTVLVG